jgi:sterol 14-demethylase
MSAALNVSLPTPPMLQGLPMLGNALDFRRDQLGLFRRGHDQFGKVFGIKLLRQPAAVLVGREHTRFFFESTDDHLSMREVYEFLIPIVGGRVLFTASRDEYEAQKKVVLPAFQGKKMRGYVTEMGNEATEWLDTLGERGQFDLVEISERLTMAMAARALLGVNFRRTLGPELQRLFGDLSGGLEFLLPTNIPLPRFIRRDRARVRLERVFTEVIAERRRHPEQHDDFLQALIGSTYLNGEPMPDRVLVLILIGALFGGRENTAGHLEWSLVHLLQNPDYLARVTAQVDDKLPEGEPVNLERLQSLQLLDWAIKESERLDPMTVTLVRYTKKAYEVDGFRVPEGWLTVCGIALTQRLPELFRDPDKYDPERYSRGEEKPYSIVGFGGGAHRCWAAQFVYNELKTILGLLLRRYHVGLVDPFVPRHTNDIGVTRPKQPCAVWYRRRA